MITRALAIALLVAAPAIAASQSLENRVASASGSVAFEFDTHRNVCGNGESIYIAEDTSPGWTTSRQRNGIHMGRNRTGEGGRCEQGPARVVLSRSGGDVVSLAVTVGGRNTRADTELGAIAPAEAARYLLAIAPQLPGRAGDHAVMGAALADAPSSWKRMLDIARSTDASESSRKATLFWVSREATAVATAGLTDVAMDDSSDNKVRSDALFYLAQRKDGEGIPSLIKVVRESKSAKLRKDAIFYLSQSRDPRALDLFEKLLAGR